MVKLPSLKDIKAQISNPAASSYQLLIRIVRRNKFILARIQAVNQDAFQATWRELINQKKAEDKTSEYMILNRPVQINEKLEVLLQVENPVQVAQFNEFRADFMADLRKRLGNNRVNVKLEVKEQQEGRKLYTSQDKFNYLSEKHPILPELKKRLGLDTDF